MYAVVVNNCTKEKPQRTLESAEKRSDSEGIFMEDIVSCSYPNRPDDHEDLCLHDFVANYDSHSKDSHGKHIYRKVTKPRLVQSQHI